MTDGKPRPSGPPIPVLSTTLTLLATAIAVFMGMSVRVAYVGALIVFLGALFAVSLSIFSLALGIAWAATPPRRNRLLAVALPILLPIAGLVVGLGIGGR